MSQGRADHSAAGIGLPRKGRGPEPPSIPSVCALVGLDTGGLSEAYRGRGKRTGRGVAVKVLPAPFDRDARARFDLDRTHSLAEQIEREQSELLAECGSSDWSGLLDDSIRAGPAVSRPPGGRPVGRRARPVCVAGDIAAARPGDVSPVTPTAGQPPPAGGGSPTPSGQPSAKAVAPPAV